MSNCIECSKVLFGRQRLFCSKDCKNQNHGNSYPAQKRRSLRRKIMIVNMMGGKCSRCGYKKNLAVLTLHHTDPSFKERSLDARSLANGNMKSVMKEVEKCELLCQNCHTEHHNPSYNDWDRLDSNQESTSYEDAALTVKLRSHV